MSDTWHQQEMFNNINKQISKLHEITAELDSLGISFGYAIVYKGQLYYILHNDFEFIKKFVQRISHGCVFSGKDMTGYCDGEYYFTVWPLVPLNDNMQIYFEHGYWYGVTISKKCGDCVVMWGFSGKNLKNNQDYLIKNKQLLMNFVHHFENVKGMLGVPEILVPSNSFPLQYGFTDIPFRGYVDKGAQRLMDSIKASAAYVTVKGKLVKITSKQRLICSTLNRVHSIKDTALALARSPNTIKTSLRTMQAKIGVHSRAGILNFCEKHHLYV